MIASKTQNSFPGGADTSPTEEDKFEYELGIPVFDEHNGTDEGLDIDFTPEVLQRIVDQNNARIKDSGDLVPVTLGHTGGPEEPEVLGWAYNFKLGQFGKDKRAAIYCDMKFTPDKYAKVKDLAAGVAFPRRSVELWDDFIVDPIALTDRPILDTVALLGAERPARSLGLGEKQARKYTYQLKENTVNPEEIKQILDALTSLPEWGYLKDCMAKAKLSEEKPEDLTEHAEDKKMDYEDEEDEMDPAKLRMQKDQLKRRFAKMQAENTAQIEAVKAENKTLFSKVAELERSARVAERKASLLQLEAEGYSFDLADELETVGDMEPARFSKHVAAIKRNYRKAPVGVNVKPAPIPAEGGSPAQSNPREVMAQAALKAAEKYGRK